MKQSALDESFVAFKANLAARGQTVPEEHRLFREAQLLERLIVTQILGKRATTQDVAKAKEAAIKFAAETRKAAQSDEAFQRMLKSLGITGEKFDQRVYEQALAEINDPTLGRAMLRWTRKLIGATWFRKPKEIDWPAKWVQFETYMRSGEWVPKFQRSENTRQVGLPFVQSVRVMLMERFKLSDSEVLNRGWALCKADFYTLLDASGVITIWGDTAIDELRALREQAENVERRLNAGEVKIKWQ